MKINPCLQQGHDSNEALSRMLDFFDTATELLEELKQNPL